MPVYITKSPSTTSSTCSIPWRKTEYMQILENFSRCLPPTFSYLIKSRSVPLRRGLHGGETGRKQPKESSQKDNGDSIRENGVEGYGGNS